MERILTTELAAHAGERVRLQGWLHRERVLSRVSFLVLRDRAGVAQVVLDEPTGLMPETVIEVEGKAVENEAAPMGIEVQRHHIRILAEPAEPPPVELFRPAPKESLPVRLDNASVALRHPLVRERFRLAARAVRAYRETLDAIGFTEIHTPKTVGTATEGGANVFKIDWFGRDAYLAQSPQLYKQTMVGVFERVYEVGPVFRAEPHETGRHLAEYTSLDMEMGFIRDHRDVMDVLKQVVFAMIEACGETPPDDVAVVRFEDVRTGEEPDLSPADERRICEGDHDRQPAAAPLRGLPRRARGARAGRGALPRLPRRIQVRAAAARRIRLRPRPLPVTDRRRREPPRGDALPAGPKPSGAMMGA